MEEERKLQALDDSELDAVSGGISIISAVKSIADEVRLGQSGQEDLSGQTAQKSALQTVLKMIWDR